MFSRNPMSMNAPTVEQREEPTANEMMMTKKPLRRSKSGRVKARSGPRILVSNYNFSVSHHGTGGPQLNAQLRDFQ